MRRRKARGRHGDGGVRAQGVLEGLTALAAAEEAMACRLIADAAAIRYACLRDPVLAVAGEDRRHARLLLEATGRRQSEPPSPAGGLAGSPETRPGAPFLRLQEDREAKLNLAARYRALGHEAEVEGDGDVAALCRALAAGGSGSVRSHRRCSGRSAVAWWGYGRSARRWAATRFGSSRTKKLY